MNVMIIYAHPVAQSFNGAIHMMVVDALERAGHFVDDCDLYAEGFAPVMSVEERQHYHNQDLNRIAIQPYVDRISRADALVFCFPTWVFGPPAILKGFFDRVFVPGFAFGIDENGRVFGKLAHIRKLAATVTYGGSYWRALMAGDPPRKIICRAIRAYTGYKASVTYLARYGMNTLTQKQADAFLKRVEKRFLAF